LAATAYGTAGPMDARFPLPLAIMPRRTLSVLANQMAAVPLSAHVGSPDVFFEGTAGCTSCHVGGTGTLSSNQDIGKVDLLGQTRPMQVPSLIDVADRAPYMHDGCAATLMDRFTNTSCGGTNHGNVSGLSGGDLDNLTTYLESL